jgi:hypothetical protein
MWPNLVQKKGLKVQATIPIARPQVSKLYDLEIQNSAGDRTSLDAPPHVDPQPPWIRCFPECLQIDHWQKENNTLWYHSHLLPQKQKKKKKGVWKLWKTTFGFLLNYPISGPSWGPHTHHVAPTLDISLLAATFQIRLPISFTSQFSTHKIHTHGQ